MYPENQARGNMDFSVKPSVAKPLEDEADLRRGRQLKKWILVGVGSFLAVLLVAGVLVYAFSAKPSVPESSTNDSPHSIIVEPSSPSQPPQPHQPDVEPIASPIVVSEPKTLLLRWRLIIVKHWKVILPVSVVIILLLIGGVTALVMSMAERDRLEREAAAREALRLQAELERAQGEAAANIIGLSPLQMWMTVLAVHVVLCVLAGFSLFFLTNSGLKGSLLLATAALLTGHSFVVLLLGLYLFFGKLVRKERWGSSMVAKIFLSILLVVYVVLAAVATPFVLLFGVLLGGLKGGSFRDMWHMASEVNHAITDP